MWPLRTKLADRMVKCQNSVSRSCSSLFVPKHNPVSVEDFSKLVTFIETSQKIAVLTGAGVSTESGIPDYRSENVGLYARSSSRPVQFQDFLKSAEVRKRYWARNFIGWPRFSSFSPNATHYALRDLEVIHQKIGWVVTQNVDGLHTKAGSNNVVELHGTAYRVICLNCDYNVSRNTFQEILQQMNPNMKASTKVIRPDGDVELTQAEAEIFRVPECPSCGGILKPDIIFFGENVPRMRVETVKSIVEDSDSLLVLGSSLSVFSGFRIVLQAAELERRIAIINIGKTRGDSYAHTKLNGRCGDIVPRLLDLLCCFSK
ncbi:NAD-dependent protein deacylase Sirt4 [Schistocerca americana]|uniref:NAD-dependent protein deacylase Sirt4 n=1 Tax=Schistocerca americana TaxID=7009 RepID=UPI001F4F27E8|nr:NAD-dependent protein deacylase Sirt4 [Schistocerca americana]